MTWNYRLVHYRKGGYGLHEVYYDAAGEPWGMTVEPASFAFDEEEGPETVVKALQMALSDCELRDVFEEPESWPGTAP